AEFQPTSASWGHRGRHLSDDYRFRLQRSFPTRLRNSSAPPYATDKAEPNQQPRQHIRFSRLGRHGAGCVPQAAVLDYVERTHRETLGQHEGHPDRARHDQTANQQERARRGPGGLMPMITFTVLIGVAGRDATKVTRITYGMRTIPTARISATGNTNKLSKKSAPATSKAPVTPLAAASASRASRSARDIGTTFVMTISFG